MEYNYILEKSNKKENSNLKTIILTAVITTFLTAITQFFLEKNHLSNEQDYWKKRYNIEQVKDVNNVRFNLIKEISEGILQLEFQAKEIKIQNAFVKYSNSKEEIEKLSKLTINYQKDLYRITSKMEIASIYFDKDVDKLLSNLGNALTENYEHNYIKSSIQGPHLPEFDLDFNTIEKLPKIKKQAFEEMLKNMQKDLDENSK
ncbi:hypothetical protein [Flavobacterium sp. 5]|uniref:hypothetical protein n=1 Tax=Flavobacterium sp. 5 TaxID=2035199 RepID=UPI000C2C9FBE|nr:hypothetical protein [Flavobacterium sp. 5]PKB15212.1 hypothetical protein CLU82_0276 [Flavobacterium sp. 5]